MQQQVAVLGAGYVGLVTAACLARADVHVSCLDVDAAKVAALRAGTVPFVEPGLPEVVRAATAGGFLTFAQPPSGLAAADCVFIAVGTPPGPDGASDLRYVWSAADEVARQGRKGVVLVLRSTVPPGTADQLRERLAQGGRSDVAVVSAPEFLAEGTAVRDFQNPDRIVLGGAPGQEAAAERVAALFAPFKPAAPRLRMDNRSAELTKYAANTFLAARVSLINEVARLCDAWGADVADVAKAIGLDPRIGPLFLRPGIGYGGSCFPKDVQALAAAARASGVHLDIVPAIEAANAAQARHAVAGLEALAGPLKGKHVAVWGIAFKPGTDDTREAASARIMRMLLDAGATVAAHDPAARLDAELARRGVRQEPSAASAARGADALLLATEWPAYRDQDPAAVAQAMRGRAVLDGRNLLDLPRWRAAGFRARGIGTGGAA